MGSHEKEPGTYPYPIESLNILQKDAFDVFEVLYLPQICFLRSQEVPNRIISDIKNLRFITLRPLDEDAGLLVSLGYNIGLWWQSKSLGDEALVQLNRNNEKIIEDLNSGEKTGVKTILYDLLKKYEGIKYRPEKTFDFLNEIAHVYSQFPKLQSNSPITILYLSANPSVKNSRTDNHIATP